MTIRRIRTVGDPVLRTPAQVVQNYDASLRSLIADMFETMYAAHGVGLAAPQIGVGLRVFTWDTGDDSGHVVNPELELGGEDHRDGEGCLSVPGLGYETPRKSAAVLRGRTSSGDPVYVEATGLLARCFQHETDHVDGVLYVDRLNDTVRKEALRTMRSPSYSETVERLTAERERLRLTHDATVASGEGSRLSVNAHEVPKDSPA